MLFLSKDTNTKCIVTTDSHYLKAEDREVHSSSLMSDYIPQNEIEQMFANTNEINNNIAVYDLAQPQIVPHLSDDRAQHPEWKEIYPKIKIRDKFEYMNKYYTSESEDDRYLIYLGLMKLTYMDLTPEKREQYLERLETELTECWLVSERLGQPISSYLLMVRNIIQIM